MRILLKSFLTVILCEFLSAQRTTTTNTSQTRSSNPSNEIFINTDRFASTTEHKLNHLFKSEINALRQELKRYDQTKTIDIVIKNFEDLKNSIDSIKDECMTNQIFGVPSNNGTNNKIDNLQHSVIALRKSTLRIEKELAIIKKSPRAVNDKNHLNQPLVHPKNDFHHFHESACTSDLHSESGIRKIRKDFFVFCEMTENDGNWIVISNRFDGSINFFRNWQEYKEGFGNIAGEYWLGLEKIYELTSARLYELMIIMGDFKGQKKYAKYSAFGISSESLGYALNILGKFSGNAGDCLSYHAGMKFSTFDVDNDEWTDGSCSKSHFGAWWYNKCDMTNLNGLYIDGVNVHNKSQAYLQGMYWRYDKKSAIVLKSVKMMIRPVE